MNTRRHRMAAVAAAFALLLTAGCGDDDGADSDTTTTTAAADSGSSGDTTAGATPASSDVDAYCEAVLGIETAGEPDIDFENATEEEIAAAIQEFATETMAPLVDAAVAVVPDEIRADAERVQQSLADIAETGDPAAFEDPEVVEANARIHGYDLANCGWNTVEVTAHDYRFEGIDDSIPAGITSFELENHGNDAHEMILIRRMDGVDDPVEDLLELPDEEVFQKVEMLGIAEPVPNGESSYLVADLTPGDYIAICFIPTGATSLDGPPPEGPPHFVNGMITEFSVS